MPAKSAMSYNAWIAAIFALIGAVSLLTRDFGYAAIFLSLGAGLFALGNDAARWRAFPAWRRILTLALLSVGGVVLAAQVLGIKP